MIYRSSVVTPVGSYQTLDSADDPRFLDTKNRPSLAQTFEVNATGARFTLAVNHLKSKGSACDDVGDPDLLDGQGNCSQTRRAAAEALVDWLATDPTGSADSDFIIMGDLNSYAMEDTVNEILAGSDDLPGTSDDFTNLIARLQGKYAYSYTFDGQAGYLDHALASSSLLSQVTGAADWHINSDEPDVLDYDTSFKPDAQDALFEPNEYRTSDHDPVIIGLNPIYYNFTGFFQPVDNLPTFNVVKAGSAIPVKFSLGGNMGLSIFASGYPVSTKIKCDTGTSQDDIETTVTAGSSNLSFDPLTNQYNYVWKTDKNWMGTCRQLTVKLIDGTLHYANFKFK
jgi:hypothetical protein